MSSINLHKDEIGIKIVYYGPGLGGKTSSLEYVHRVLNPDNRGQMISLATGIDRTLYFDFLPVKLPKVKNFTVRMSLYTVPGQVHYNATRKLVLQGADGIIFVADSQPARHDANLESIENLYDNLQTHGMNPQTTPLVIQFNKRDLPEVMSMEEMGKALNKHNVPVFETCALSGTGVFDALKAITKLVLSDLRNKGIYQEGDSKEVDAKDLDGFTPPGDQAQKAKALSDTEKKDDSAASKTGSTDKTEDKSPATGDDASPKIKKKSEISALHSAISSHLETSISQAQTKATPYLSHSNALSFSALWRAGTCRDQIIGMEKAIESGKHNLVLANSPKLLENHLAEAEVQSDNVAEALLALGIHGGHYVRFKSIIGSQNPSVENAVFCIFFLTDIELRMQAAGGIQVLEQ